MTLISALIPIASQLFPRMSSTVLASSGYTLTASRIGDSSDFGVWTEKTARRQDRAWRPIIEAAKAGHPREDVASLFDALGALPTATATVLEVGCGGGYNSELIEMRLPDVRYLGIDLSAAMVSVAKEHYPNRGFVEGSAYDLPVANASHDVVVDGVALIHMPDWRVALAEYARAAGRFVVLHGLTLSDSAPTTQFAKYAYGQPSIELLFNREELVEACSGLGLERLSEHRGLDYDLARYLKIKTVSETWVLQKV
jgi:ubiquinone/menaquinone biosynthesis C-methylase UbiE